MKAFRAAEIQSKRRPESGLVGRFAQPTAKAAIPIGMLTPNNHCHGPTARMAEATVGPIADEADTTMALSPMPRPRLRCG